MEEVNEAVFQLGAIETPGPIGLEDDIYHHCWDEIQQDVFNMVKSFFDSGIFYPSINRSYISLILKVPSPKGLTQFRPINFMQNFYNKIIYKVMVNRLEPWLPELIGLKQSTLVSGRLIQDNILIVQKVLHQLRVTKRK